MIWEQQAHLKVLPYLTSQHKTSNTQITNRNRHVIWILLGVFWEVFACLHQPIDGVFRSHSKLLTACLRCYPLNVALTGPHQSAWSHPLFNTADSASLQKAFVLRGLPKILTVLGRDSTLIWGLSLFLCHGDSFPDSMRPSMSAVEMVIKKKKKKMMISSWWFCLGGYEWQRCCPCQDV